ncbi:MAG: universal stress protein [Methanoculleaceae archaeon]
MFRNILVAVDGSDSSMAAFRKAVGEARVWNAALKTIYVIETGLFTSIPPDNTIEMLYTFLQQEGQEIIERCNKIAVEEGVAHSGFIRQGHAGSEILNLAREEGADLIVVGSHGKSEVDRLLLGSVSEHVVRHSPITTMVVRR